MTEAPYPARGGRGRPPPLPAVMPGVRVPMLKPYGGLTYDEWMQTDLQRTEIPDARFGFSQEDLGKQIIGICRRDGISASKAADKILA